jgi:hypothetical protein
LLLWANSGPAIQADLIMPALFVSINTAYPMDCCCGGNQSIFYYKPDYLNIRGVLIFYSENPDITPGKWSKQFSNPLSPARMPELCKPSIPLDF